MVRIDLSNERAQILANALARIIFRHIGTTEEQVVAEDVRNQIQKYLLW